MSNSKKQNRNKGRSRRDKRLVRFTLGRNPLDRFMNLMMIIASTYLAVQCGIGLNNMSKPRMVAYAETPAQVMTTEYMPETLAVETTATSPVIVYSESDVERRTVVEETEPTFEPVVKYVSARAGVNVRTQPNTDSEILATIQYNGEVVVIGEENGWYRTEAGYMSSEFLSDEKCPTLPYTEEDLYVMAHVLSGEAQHCSDQEQRYVASVVMNRKNSSRFPNTIKGVIFQKGQYACTWDGNYYRKPTQRNWDNARWVLENGSILPEYVIYQSGFPQGKNVYVKTDVHYYCY